jgi:hypothetical protein
MTAPRIPLFQRKGASPPASSADKKPAVVIAIGHGDPHPPGGPKDNADAPDDGGQSSVQCPNCGCTFDPDTGDILNQDDYSDADASQHPMPAGLMPDTDGGSQ